MFKEPRHPLQTNLITLFNVPHHPLQSTTTPLQSTLLPSTTPPSLKYRNTIFQVPHPLQSTTHPLQSSTTPSSKYHATLSKVPHNAVFKIPHIAIFKVTHLKMAKKNKNHQQWKTYQNTPPLSTFAMLPWWRWWLTPKFTSRTVLLWNINKHG